MKNPLLFLAILFLFSTSFAQTLSIPIEKNHFQTDAVNKIIVSRIDDISVYSNNSSNASAEVVLDGQVYTFVEVPSTLSYSDSYPVMLGSEVYTLYFTQLPLISIVSSAEIVDEPKVGTDFVYADDEQVFTSFCGVEFRGVFSLTFPKKTLDLEFWEDVEGEDSRDAQFGGLREDDDWVLDALYNEPLRLRAFVSHKLWTDMHQLYYAQDEPKAIPGARVMYVELFLNNKYNGIYMLSEQVDRKQLKLKKYDDDNSVTRGALYKGEGKGATTFYALPPIDNTKPVWGGYEQKHPDEDDVIDWTDLYNFTDFVRNAPTAEFNAGIWEKMDMDNAMDYFIFLNMTFAADNTGKNIYLGRYDTDTPYFYTAWDLDGTLGWKWDGTQLNIVDSLLTNGLYDRIEELDPAGANNAMAQKWTNYRNGILSADSLKSRINEAYDYLTFNNVYDRERKVFDNYPFDAATRLYTLDWIDRRLAFLDAYFEANLGLDDFTESTRNLTIFPNPANTHISIGSTLNENLTNEPYLIADMGGRVVKEGSFSSGIPINISKMNEGIYLLQIKGETHKIIKN